MKATTQFFSNLYGFLHKMDIDPSNVEVEVFIGDILEIDLELYNDFGVNTIKSYKLGDKIELAGIKCLLTGNLGITIKLK